MWDAAARARPFPVSWNGWTDCPEIWCAMQGTTSNASHTYYVTSGAQLRVRTPLSYLSMPRRFIPRFGVLLDTYQLRFTQIMVEMSARAHAQLHTHLSTCIHCRSFIAQKAFCWFLGSLFPVPILYNPRQCGPGGRHSSATTGSCHPTFQNSIPPPP